MNEDLDHHPFGVTDPAEESERDRERPPIGRLDVALDHSILRDQRVAGDMDRQPDRGLRGRQQSAVHAAPGVIAS